MKRMIVILSVLLVTLPVFAGDFPPMDVEWPDSFIGDHVVPDCEPEAVQMYLVEFEDFYPWSVPNPVGRHFYFGTLQFCVCGGVDTAIFDIRQIAGRSCTEAPWGSPYDPQICSYYAPRDVSVTTYYLEWVEDAGSYMMGNIAYWGVQAGVLTVVSAEDGLFRFVLGTMHNEDGVMVWGNSRTRFTYWIEPFNATQIGATVRSRARVMPGQ